MTSRLTCSGCGAQSYNGDSAVYYCATCVRGHRERISDLETALRQARSVIGSVEWTFNAREETECPWCHGDEPDEPPSSDWYDDEEDFNLAMEDWLDPRERWGHKADCSRQDTLVLIDEILK